MPFMHMFTLILALALQSTTTGFTPDQLWQDWPDERFVTTPAPCLRPADLTAQLQSLAEAYPGSIQLEEIGQSIQGRPIHMVTLGHGPRTVLLWSHGRLVCVNANCTMGHEPAQQELPREAA